MADRCADKLAAAVEWIAALLGEQTGRCGECGRPTRLVCGGLVPTHHSTEPTGLRHCIGGERPPEGVAERD